MDRRKKELFFHSSKFPLKNRLAVTTGEPAGIGQATAVQALKRLGPKKDFQFLLWTSPKAKTLKIPGFQVAVFSNVKPALKSPFKENQILQIKSRGGPGEQLKEAGRLCLNHQASALITGPVNKKSLSKYKVRGQTDLLKKLCRTKSAYMCFRGRFFNVILLTDHIPLKQVSINQKTLKHFLEMGLMSRHFLAKELRKKPLGLLGLNPHAGEEGILGTEEEALIKPVIKKFSSKEIQGPLSPDAGFLRKNWGRYSFFMALYHDQGLIPFKMIHAYKGFAQTLGLPFLRLGVDHGTGKDLKEKEASSDSFLKAIQEALRLINLRKLRS